jgi:hypothetical protein
MRREFSAGGKIDALFRAVPVMGWASTARGLHREVMEVLEDNKSPEIDLLERRDDVIGLFDEDGAPAGIARQGARIDLSSEVSD